MLITDIKIELFISKINIVSSDKLIVDIKNRHFD